MLANHLYLFIFKCLCFWDQVSWHLLLCNSGEGHCSAADTLQLDLGGAGARGPWIWPLRCGRFTQRIKGYQSVCSVPRNDPSALQSPEGTGDHAGGYQGTLNLATSFLFHLKISLLSVLFLHLCRFTCSKFTYYIKNLTIQWKLLLCTCLFLTCYFCLN